MIGKGQDYVNILGIKVFSTSLVSLLTNVREKLSYNRKFYIVTPNPELVLASMKNAELKNALNSADYAIPDGVGLSYASRFLFGRSLNIIPGRVFFIKLIELANKKGWKVFFLGGKGLEAQIAAQKLRLSYKNIKIETFAGPIVDEKGVPNSEKDKKLQREAISLINKFSPKILFVAFNNPKQEIWIYKNLKSLDTLGAMTVGGTFRYVAGLSKLPPKWMEKAGLEWVFRLITEPYRVGRVLNAVVVFPLRVLFYRIFGR